MTKLECRMSKEIQMTKPEKEGEGRPA